MTIVSFTYDQPDYGEPSRAEKTGDPTYSARVYNTRQGIIIEGEDSKIYKPLRYSEETGTGTAVEIRESGLVEKLREEIEFVERISERISEELPDVETTHWEYEVATSHRYGDEMSPEQEMAYRILEDIR